MTHKLKDRRSHWERAFLRLFSPLDSIRHSTQPRLNPLNQAKQHLDLFSKPVNMTEFPVICGSVTKDDIRRNRGHTAERLGFCGRLIHGHSLRAWMKELKSCLGEAVGYAKAAGVSD